MIGCPLLTSGVIPKFEEDMTEASNNRIGIFTCISIALIISIFIYLISKSGEDYQFYFLTGVFQILMGFIFALGAIRPHQCIFYRIFPIVFGFYLYPFVGDAVPFYLAGIAIVTGMVFTVFGLIGYFGVF